MADQQQQIPNAPFPAPPPFWKHFTAENVARLKDHKASVGKGGEQTAIPSELAYLEPPPPPQDNYSIFGEEQTVRHNTHLPFFPFLPSVSNTHDHLLDHPTNPSNNDQKISFNLPELSSLGITQLYPPSSSSTSSRTQSQPLQLQHQHQNYLLLLLRSLHVNFGELTTILARNPAVKDEKLETIKNLFQNAHWLINMYRPHQARETLIALMEDQIEEGRREMEECDRVSGKVETALREIAERSKAGRGVAADPAAAATAAGAATTAHMTDKEQERDRLWKMMSEIEIDVDTNMDMRTD
jgi:mediator of RNA polymerase II transcription subunit 7